MRINLLPLISFLIILCLLLFTTGCKKEELAPGFERVTIEMGNTYPNKKKAAVFSTGDRFQTFVIECDPSMQAVAPGIDSLDWNKFEGIIYVNGDEVVSGWRYKKKGNLLQLNVYVHKSGNIVHSEQSIDVPLIAKHRYRIEYGLDTNNNPYLAVQDSYNYYGKYTRDIQINSTRFGRYRFDMWGGSTKAPRRITYLKNSNI